MNLITNNAKFTRLVSEGKIDSSLKTYSDSLLFYYLGYLAASVHDGEFLEIGVGGSTYVLSELSELFGRNFNIVDLELERLTEFSNNKYFTNAKNIQYNISSTKLINKNINALIYCHIDGDKSYEIAKSDLEFCLSKLTTNGIICQDDYGNNKWPMVTDIIHELLHAGKLKILIVGDSSCWVTLPKYYDYWYNMFDQDYEFKLLGKFLNIAKNANYLYMNSTYQPKPMVDSNELDYFDSLLQYESVAYLQMPYMSQSTPGIYFRRSKKYKLNSIWYDIRGHNWPVAPISKEDIDNLPTWIKDEIYNLHKIHDMYLQESYYEKFCIRSNQEILGG
jgi:hypothetical protein